MKCFLILILAFLYVINSQLSPPHEEKKDVHKKFRYGVDEKKDIKSKSKGSKSDKKAPKSDKKAPKSDKKGKAKKAKKAEKENKPKSRYGSIPAPNRTKKEENKSQK